MFYNENIAGLLCASRVSHRWQEVTKNFQLHICQVMKYWNEKGKQFVDKVSH